MIGRALRERQSNRRVFLWTTLIGGFLSSLVKWGPEVNVPPRVPGEVSPPSIGFPRSSFYRSALSVGRRSLLRQIEQSVGQMGRKNSISHWLQPGVEESIHRISVVVSPWFA